MSLTPPLRIGLKDRFMSRSGQSACLRGHNSHAAEFIFLYSPALYCQSESQYSTAVICSLCGAHLAKEIGYNFLLQEFIQDTDRHQCELCCLCINASLELQQPFAICILKRSGRHEVCEVRESPYLCLTPR